VTTTRKGTASFAPRARLLKLLGEELITDEVVAVTELVKNAHDADATSVAVHLLTKGDGSGEIMIRDDGHGMDLDTLLTSWMQPAGSKKGSNGKRYTARGRRMLGEKGVGRFAADKLATQMEIVSRPADANSEVRAVFDWTAFEENDLMLSDVESRWEVRPPEWLESQGTVLRLTGLRTSWTERRFRRLAARLARLVSPARGANGFHISLQSDEFPLYAGEVAGFLEGSPHWIEAELTRDGQVLLRTKNGTDRDRWSSSTPGCGPLKLRIHAFDLETEALARVGPRAEVRAWLRHWSGISMYRDGFRVWPYGEPHDDWLRLDQRRVNNPVLRLSNNQVVGIVEITADDNPGLRDQTNREGLIHNDAYAELRELVLIALTALEGDRHARRRPALPAGETETDQAREEGDPLSDSLGTLEALADEAGGRVGTRLRALGGRLRDQFDQQQGDHLRMLDAYLPLAATGHVSGPLGQLIRDELSELRTAAAELRRELGDTPRATRVRAVEDHLSTTVDYLDLLVDSPSRTLRRRSVNLRVELERIALMIEPELATRMDGARIQVKGDSTELPRAEMRPGAVFTMIYPFIQNSLEWGREGKRLTISLEVEATDDSVDITVKDTGRGISPGLHERVFHPGVSGSSAGTGMGLTLARSVIVSHGGSVSVVRDRRRRGATFRITLPRKRARATAPRRKG